MRKLNSFIVICLKLIRNYQKKHKKYIDRKKERLHGTILNLNFKSMELGNKLS